jgi:hypothetical protein
MALLATEHASIDRHTHVHLIRATFAQSALFREAAVSEPSFTPEGEAVLDVSFDGGPTIFSVVAGSEIEAYAVLHEVAQAMVEIERRHGARC